MRRTPSADVVAFRYAGIFNSALREVKAIRRRYLAQYLRYPFGALPTRYLKDLRAFAVLASATLEQCAEDLIWAHLYHMASDVNSRAAGAALSLKAANLLQGYGEASLDKSHGLKGNQFRDVSAAGGITPTVTPPQWNSFEQLGIIRNESAHSYVVTVRDPKDVWAYACDVMTCVRAVGIQCATRAVGFRPVPPP